MKNVTVSLDDDTYRQARRRAAKADRSLSAVVREYLQSYGAEESGFDRLARCEKELLAELTNRPGEFRASDRLSREELTILSGFVKSVGRRGNDGSDRYQRPDLRNRSGSPRSSEGQDCARHSRARRLRFLGAVLQRIHLAIDPDANSGRLSFEQAIELVMVWRRHPVQALDLAVLDIAVDVTRRTRYSWWNILIIAAAIVLDCEAVLTEDMPHGRVIDGVTIVNPVSRRGMTAEAALATFCK